MTSPRLDSIAKTPPNRLAGPLGDAVGTSCSMASRYDEHDREPGHLNAPAPSQPLPAIETQRILTVFGSNTRSGYWEPPERLEVFSLFGGVKLDFTDANLYSGVTIVNCLAMFGGIDIIVPSDLEVDANGTGLFGGFDLKALKKQKLGIFSRRRERTPELDHEPEDEPPLLRVRGFALFGGVSVRVR